MKNHQKFMKTDTRTHGHGDSQTLGHTGTGTVRSKLGQSDTRTVGQSDTRTVGHTDSRTISKTDKTDKIRKNQPLLRMKMTVLSLPVNPCFFVFIRKSVFISRNSVFIPLCF